jgi:hypothetical protein
VKVLAWLTALAAAYCVCRAGFLRGKLPENRRKNRRGALDLLFFWRDPDIYTPQGQRLLDSYWLWLLSGLVLGFVATGLLVSYS